MKKRIFICGKEYQFNELRDLRDTFKENNIIISNHVELGDSCSIESGVVFETAVKAGDFCIFEKNVRLGSDCKLDDYCEIKENSTIMTCAKLGKYVVIGMNLTIGEEAKILPYTHLNDTIHIQGSMNSVTYVGNNRISIGCVNETVEDWKAKAVEIGKTNKYSAQAISEYIGHIAKVEEFLKQENDRLDF